MVLDNSETPEYFVILILLLNKTVKSYYFSSLPQPCRDSITDLLDKHWLCIAFMFVNFILCCKTLHQYQQVNPLILIACLRLRNSLCHLAGMIIILYVVPLKCRASLVAPCVYNSSEFLSKPA